jgi:hypothetical protein
MPGARKKTATAKAVAPVKIIAETSSAPSDPVEEKKNVKAPKSASAKVSAVPPKSAIKTPSNKKTSAKIVKIEEPVVEEVVVEEPVEETVEEIEICTPETCNKDVEESEEEEEEEEEDEEEEGEEDASEGEEIFISERMSTVPITSITSPRVQGNRSVMSPRIADIKSPKRIVPRSAVSPFESYGKLGADDILYSEDQIFNQTFDSYVDIRAADVITHLHQLDRCPYYFRSGGGVCGAENAEEAIPVQYSADIEEGFDVFECRKGILAFMPVDDIDFGPDENDLVALKNVPEHVYVLPILSSGSNGGDIRFVETFAIWGLMTQEEYQKISTRKDYRDLVKRMKLLSLDQFSD